MTFTVTRRVHFCYGHRLLDYRGKCRHLHGHNAVAEVSFRRRTLDRRGMALDFDDIKKSVQVWVDEELDHRLLLNRRDPLVKLLQDLGEPVVAMPGNPTAENIAKLLFEFAAGKGLPVSGVRLWENPNSCAEYGP
ncbi:MAG: 6-carboxytetrahydropterin synthase [Elusimicrobiota bacterium]|jgi:6-pyruvoyltetrahydropterin/6-carboxytetrahydropterin synthase